jgi:hypothetical protein
MFFFDVLFWLEIYFSYMVGQFALNNSVFFPNVTVTALPRISASESDIGASERSRSRGSGASSDSVSVSVACTDLEKYSEEGYLFANDGVGVAVSILVCTLPLDFRELISKVCYSVS